MNPLDAELARRLEALREAGLYRELRQIDSPQSPHVLLAGRQTLNFSSNDYLGLANHPALKAAAVRAVERFGAGAGASRLICGSLAPHHDLEAALASFKGVEAALTFSTGYAAASAAICALLSRSDVIILDKLVHACIVDAARLSGATIRVYPHNDLNRLEHLLKWAAGGRRPNPNPEGQRETVCPDGTPARTVLVVTESVFSMDGDQAPLREIVDLKDRFGAWLMVDEAHATGLYGPNRRGLAEELGVAERIEIQMGTLGKAFGASGGYLCGSRVLIDYLVNRARTFIFSTAPVPAAAAAAAAGIQLVQSAEGEDRRSRLWRLVDQIRGPRPPSGAVAGAPAGHTSRAPDISSAPRGAILPLMIGDETRALEAAAALRERDILIPAIRYPTVARGAARLRLTLTAAHEPADVERLSAALDSLRLTI